MRFYPAGWSRLPDLTFLASAITTPTASNVFTGMSTVSFEMLAQLFRLQLSPFNGSGMEKGAILTWITPYFYLDSCGRTNAHPRC